MGMPSKLKNHNLFVDGATHIGIVGEVTIPKLVLKMEEWRGGGMLGPIMVDQGLEKIEVEYTMGGLVSSAVRRFGETRHDGVLLRHAGAYQEDGAGRVQAAEAIMRGRFPEIDFGNQKPGDDTEHKQKLACSYYKFGVDGVNWFEIDLLAGIFIVFGVDRYAQIRAALGN